MKKRGQVVSTDLIIGLILFLAAFGLFYNRIAVMQEKPSISLEVTADYLFDGIELSLEAYGGEIDFFGENSYTVDKGKLSAFINNLDYEQQNEIITGNIKLPSQINELDFCMYFVNASGSVRKQIGPDNKTILIKEGTNCGDPTATANNPKPRCVTPPYTHALKLQRPVIYGDDEILMMNVLLCGVKS